MVHKLLFALYYIQFTRLSSNDSAIQTFAGSSTSLNSFKAINQTFMTLIPRSVQQNNVYFTTHLDFSKIAFISASNSFLQRWRSSTGCTALGNSQNSSYPGGYILSMRLHLVAEPITSYQTEQNLTLTHTSHLWCPSLMRITNWNALVRHIHLSFRRSDNILMNCRNRFLQLDNPWSPITFYASLHITSFLNHTGSEQHEVE